MRTILFTDFDGTLYDPSYKIVLSPFFNYQSGKLMKKHNIEFVVVTGRSDWTWVDDLELTLLGLPKPNSIVYGAGTHILRRTKSGFMHDRIWHQKVAQTEVVWTDVMSKPHPWNKKLIEETLAPTLETWHLSFKPSTNPFICVIDIANFQIRHVRRLMTQLALHWSNGIKMLLSEKLYRSNTIKLFNGYMLLIPDVAGKDKAVEYLLEQEKKKPNALFFGDALIDVPMLAMKRNKLVRESYAYGVHMTPLARENLKISDPGSKIVHFPGSAPKAFLKILKAYTKGRPIEARQHAKIVEPT